MKCKHCGKPMVMYEDEFIRDFSCEACGESVRFCMLCKAEAVSRTEHHDGYVNAGVYCPQCRKWLMVTSLPVLSEKESLQTIRKEITAHCLTYENVYEDYPFHDQNWCVIRHKENKKIFAWIFERNEQIWVNLKCDPQWTSFWRSAFPSVIPAYHLNKTHWNSVILDGSIPDRDVHRMVQESYELTKPHKTKADQRT